MGQEAFEHAFAGGALPGGPECQGFGETIFGDAFNGGVHEVIFLPILCVVHQSILVVHHYMGHMLYLQASQSMFMGW